MTSSAVGMSEASGSEIKWEETIRPMTHGPDCPFNESTFQTTMKNVLFSPKSLEEALDLDNRRHLENAKDHHRKSQVPLYKKPTKEIANDPRVLEYLAEQREMVMENR